MVTWSALHRALSLGPGDFAYAMAEAIRQQRLPETADLDWKANINKDDGGYGIIKDIAAMANSGGGVIVFGITETNSYADGIKDLPLDEKFVQGWLLTRVSQIEPTVHGVTVTMKHKDESDHSQGGVVFLNIPSSPNAPHTVRYRPPRGAPADALLIPIRRGPNTHFMGERELERAYQTRFDRRGTDLDRIRRTTDELAPWLRNRTMWLTLVAMPANPTDDVPLSRDMLWDLFETTGDGIDAARPPATSKRRIPYWDEASDRWRMMINNRKEMQIGLRRFLYDADWQDPRLELHHTGSVVIAHPLHFDETFHDVLVLQEMEMHILETVVLAHALQRAGVVTGTVIYQVGILRQDHAEENAPVTVVAERGFDSRRDREIFGRPTPHVLPVTVEQHHPGSPLELARQLARDLVSQFGIGLLLLLDP